MHLHVHIMCPCIIQDELEPYEKLLSPLAKRRYRPTMTHYSLRGLQTEDSTASSLNNTSNKETSKKEEIETKEEEPEEDEEGEEEEEEEEEVGGEEEEEEEEDEETGYYNLRKRRPVVYQYQPVIQVIAGGGRGLGYLRLHGTCI